MTAKVLKIACIQFAILWCAPLLWSQVEPSATGGDYDQSDDVRMSTPPPVTGGSFPTTVGSEEARSNHISAGIVLTAAYTDNVMNIQSTSQISDEMYSILPTFSLVRKSGRQDQDLYYGAGFTFYQHTSELNAVTQTAAAEYKYHLSRYSTISVRDSFNQNSNSYNQPNPSLGGPVSGSTQPSTGILVFPNQDQLSNSVSGEVAYQFAKNAMIGGGGNYGFLHYGNSGGSTTVSKTLLRHPVCSPFSLAQCGTAAVYDSDSIGGSFFYTRRVSGRHYLGANYAYSRFSSYPDGTITNTNAILGFYTIYLTRTFSVSVSGGPQHFTATQAPHPSTSSWTPALLGSIGWQTKHANLAASYTRIVSGGGGLQGAYYSNIADVNLSWLLTRKWSVGLDGGYSNYRSATPLYTTGNQGGHTAFGSLSVQHKLSQNLNGVLGYSHFQQSYGGIESANNFPNSNRVFISISYGFMRPLGR
jgi:hypothetical protein